MNSAARLLDIDTRLARLEREYGAPAGSRAAGVEALDARLSTLEAHLRAPVPDDPVLAIARDAAWATRQPVRVIQGYALDAPAVNARRAVCWAARAELRLSLPVIGRALGGRDHTTVLGAVRTAEALRDRDPAFRALTDRLAAQARARADAGDPA